MDVKDLHTLLDAMPAMILVVDEDVRVLERNQAARRLMPDHPADQQVVRAGEAFHCVRFEESTAGCGHTNACQRCILRSAVAQALAGTAVVRRRARLEVLGAEGVQEIIALVSATPVEVGGVRRVMLVIDNISDLTEMHTFLPICCVCKKIRPDKETWMPLEDYFKDYWDVDFSHSYCPECRDRELASMLAELDKISAPGCPPTPPSR